MVAAAAGLALAACSSTQDVLDPSNLAPPAADASGPDGARRRGIAMAGAADDTGYLLRGYFTPLVEGRETTVIFVWDVYDAEGNRVHRISGQEKAASGTGEGWSAVPLTAMQAIGTTTVDQFAAWAASRG